MLPLFVLVVIIGSAIFAGALAPHSPEAISLSNKLIPPFWMEGGTPNHPLGTDRLGRDMLSRMIYGGRASLIIALVGLSIGAGIGISLGTIAGYYGGIWDAVIMSTCDAFLSFPIILFAIVLAVGFDPSLAIIIVSVVFVVWARFARMARGEVLAWKERDFVRYAQMVGVSAFRIILRHIFPNILNTLVVLFTLLIAWVILVEAALSFLGAGIPPPTPTWGGMISQGRDYLTSAWWLAFFPGMAIVVTCLSFNLIGDWLQELLDPKQRQI